MCSLAEGMCIFGDFGESIQWPELLIGLLIGFILGLLVWGIIRCVNSFKNKSNFISVTDSEKGCFSINSKALKSFVKNVASEFPDLVLNSVALSETREGYVLSIHIKANPDSELLTVRKELRDKIYAQLEAKLGISEQISSVNFDVDDFAEPVNGEKAEE